MGMNPFRIIGDLSHALSKCILIWAIHSNKSSEGVSLITQALYACVFLTRYLDVFWISSWWNFCFKVFYILSSFYIIFCMVSVYARTREREKAWKLGAFALSGSLIAAPLVMLVFKKKVYWGFMEVCWVFSIILESVCVLPQLLLLRQTTVPTVIDSYYLLTLGAYRGFYCLNWIVRELDSNDRKPELISIIFGVIQTAFYADFAWVYYTRQRVKLRHGGLVDQDDMQRGWLLRNIFGYKAVVGDDSDNEAEDEESQHRVGGQLAQPPASSKWGKRGISVSADDTTLATERGRQGQPAQAEHFTDQETGIVSVDDTALIDPDAKMRDPDELARIDDEDDDSDDGILPAYPRPDGPKNRDGWDD